MQPHWHQQNCTDLGLVEAELDSGLQRLMLQLHWEKGIYISLLAANSRKSKCFSGGKAGTLVFVAPQLLCNYDNCSPVKTLESYLHFRLFSVLAINFPSICTDMDCDSHLSSPIHHMKCH